MEDLERQQLSSFTSSDPDEMWLEWTSQVTTILDAHTPFCIVRPCRRRKPWVDKDLVASIPLTKKLRHKHDRFPTSTTLVQYRQARNLAVNTFRQRRNAYFQDLCTKYKENPQLLWTVINTATRRKLQTCPIDEPSVPAASLQAFFASVTAGGPNQEPSTKAVPAGAGIDTGVCTCGCNCEPLTSQPLVTVGEVIRSLKTLSTRKCTGLDGISAHLLRTLAPVLAPSLNAIFNASLDSAKMPTSLKSVMVKPKHKGGDPTSPTNYRPLAICPIAAKVLEKLADKRVEEHISSHLPTNQYAYRVARSTEDALLHAVTVWQQALDNGVYVGVIFVDIRKAFNTVQFQLLVDELAAVGIKSKALSWFCNYLYGRENRVVMGSSTSAAFVP